MSNIDIQDVLRFLEPVWAELMPVVRSLAVLGLATFVQVLLKVFARRDFGATATSPSMVTWQDAIFWGDWTSNILLAFMVLALQASDSLGIVRVGALFLCLLGTFALSQYVRWYGTQASTGNVTEAGMKISNIASMAIILVALFAGVDLFK